LPGSSLLDHFCKGHEIEYRRRFGTADIAADCIALQVCDTCLPKLPLDYNFFLSDKAVRQKVCPFYAQERVCELSLVIFSQPKTTKVGARVLSAFPRKFKEFHQKGAGHEKAGGG
jgi:hypothetical protein